MPTTVRSHAKVNLGLGIGAPRPDGYHALCTVYQTLELHDLVTVSARPAPETALRLTSNDQRVPTDARNTAWKMVALALEALGITAEVEIHIEKQLPVQGGLGAGSANAVAALVGLEAELGHPGFGVRRAPPIEQSALDGWGTQLDSSQRAGAPSFSRPLRKGWESTRLEIAAKVGSDVPLFLVGGTVLGVDRGQVVHPLPDLEPVWCVVAAPAIGVSTPQAFRDWDALCAAESLTAEASADKLNKLSRAYASAFAEAIPEGRQGVGSSGVLLNEANLAGPQESALVRTGITSWIENEFERVVFLQHPSLAEIKRTLAASGTLGAALHASLSGSGSALFGLYRTRGDAEAACQRLESAGVRSLLTRTLPRSKYWREMLLTNEG
ncbi:MAG: 4-(cytidine 5'-diphospho)-2-C-methyl-D-erythritol kinase [Terracidiphilus sp.]|jgi:4-diphosphocytidyl-2-C-methyl-D-erythritol kinase